MRLKVITVTVKLFRLFLAFIIYTDITAELFLPYTLGEVSHSEYALMFLFRYSCILKKYVFSKIASKFMEKMSSGKIPRSLYSLQGDVLNLIT